MSRTKLPALLIAVCIFFSGSASAQVFVCANETKAFLLREHWLNKGNTILTAQRLTEAECRQDDTAEFGEVVSKTEQIITASIFAVGNAVRAVTAYRLRDEATAPGLILRFRETFHTSLQGVP